MSAPNFRQGDAAALPFPADTFDFIVCRAAFKNFGDPLGVLREIHRVLRSGGRALIIDMRRDASDQSVADQVAKMHLGGLDAFLTKFILSSLRRRAYRREDFERMLLESPFGRGQIARCSSSSDLLAQDIRLAPDLFRPDFEGAALETGPRRTTIVAVSAASSEGRQ